MMVSRAPAVPAPGRPARHAAGRPGGRATGPAGDCAARDGASRHDPARHDAIHHGAARHDVARHGAARHGAARHGAARHGAARPDAVHHDAARYDAGRHGAVRPRARAARRPPVPLRTGVALRAAVRASAGHSCPHLSRNCRLSGQMPPPVGSLGVHSGNSLQKRVSSWYLGKTYMDTPGRPEDEGYRRRSRAGDDAYLEQRRDIEGGSPLRRHSPDEFGTSA